MTRTIPMNRRRLLSLLGLAPVVAVIPATTIARSSPASAGRGDGIFGRKTPDWNEHPHAEVRAFISAADMEADGANLTYARDAILDERMPIAEMTLFDGAGFEVHSPRVFSSIYVDGVWIGQCIGTVAIGVAEVRKITQVERPFVVVVSRSACQCPGLRQA